MQPYIDQSFREVFVSQVRSKMDLFDSIHSDLFWLIFALAALVVLAYGIRKVSEFNMYAAETDRIHRADDESFDEDDD